MTPAERASLRTLAQHELDYLHECPVCIGTREDLHEGVADGTPCQRCGGAGRWDERKPLADALLKVLDALAAAEEWRDHWKSLVDRLDPQLHEANAEIARLKAGGCARDQTTTQYCAEAVTAMTENKRLREALERIANAHDEHATLLKTCAENGEGTGAEYVLEWAQKIARGALGGQPT